MKNKKGQIFIFAATLLILLLIINYSLETENTYIVKSSKYNLLNNIMHQTCNIGYLSNGSYIENRYDVFAGNVSLYCKTLSYNCTLTINNNTVLPANNSLINYTLFSYHINYTAGNFKYSGYFNC